MIAARNNFLGGLDLDSSFFALDKSRYVDALNITRDAVQSNQDLVITNIIGNVLVDHTYPGRIVYRDEDSFYNGVLLNNGDGTQTMTLTFGSLVSPISVDLEYYDGSSWTSVSGGTTSPQTYTMPYGSYNYKVTVTYGSGTSVTILNPVYVIGRSKVIGSKENTLRNTVVFMRWNSEDCHGIYEYDRATNSITKIFENLVDTNNVDVLGFTEHDKITSIAIYNRDEGDLLFFLDSLSRPTSLNITSFKAGTYTPVTRQIIDTAKMPPLNPPSYVYGNDTTYRSNSLMNTFFRFKQRWVYDDNEKSSWSPISQVNIPTQILDDTYSSVITNNNVITVSLDSGYKNVKAVEIAMSYAHKANEWVDFSLVESLDKSKLSIGDNTQYAYSFYNDSAYPLLDVIDSDALFYYVPDEANAMILANGNILVYGGITEGYDRTLSPNVTITINTTTAANVGDFSGFVYLPPPGSYIAQVPQFTFGGTPLVGTVITIKLKRLSDNVLVTAGTYTTVSGDTYYSVIEALKTNINATSSGNSWFGATHPTPTKLQFDFYCEGAPVTPKYYSQYCDLIITPPSSSTSDSVPAWKWSTTRRIGIAYYDQKGKTNGVLYDAKISFPAYAEDVSHNILLPYINVKIYHTPPSWAYSYQFVITKDPTTYLFWETVSVNTSESDYLYFEVTNFTTNSIKNPTTATVLSYTFQDGDRMRLIRRQSDQNVFADTYDASILGLLNEPTINGVVQTGKQFIKIKKVAPLSTVDYSSNFFIIEIYRPSRKIGENENEVFYEFGQQYSILNPTLSTRVHSGNVSNQDALGTPAESNLYNGDSYFRTRAIYLTTNVATFSVQDKNVVDFYASSVSSVDGRPSVIDVNAKRQYFGALIRFGQAYQANTNVNGLNAFYADDFEEVDYSLGSVRRMTTRERFVRVFQDYKIGMMPLYSQINKTSNGDVVVQTDKLLNPIQYYVGNFGIGTAPESLVSYNNSDYFADNNRGVYCRVSNDGVTAISILYKINSWATDKLPQRIGNYKIYGGYDPKSNNFISALEATDTDDAYTIAFDEESNAFESFLSYHPENIVTLGTLLITFKDGNLYTHDSDFYNRFYGVDYESNISLVFNDNELFKKTWIGISQISNVIWDCPLIYSNVNSYGNQRQETSLATTEFKLLEQMPSASLKRDIHSRGGKLNGSAMKGNYLVVELRKTNANSLVYLAMVSMKYIDSPLTAR
jgi:hypothetical protein